MDINKINERADEVLGLNLGNPISAVDRVQGAATDLCRVPSFEEITNVAEQLALGGHLVHTLDTTLGTVIDLICDAQAMARHKPVAALFGLEATRTLILQMQMLESALMQCSATLMAEHVSTLPPAEAEAMMAAARARVAKMAERLSDGDLADMLAEMLGK